MTLSHPKKKKHPPNNRELRQVSTVVSRSSYRVFRTLAWYESTRTIDWGACLVVWVTSVWGLDPFHLVLDFKSIHEMAAIGLVDIPPEIQLQIAEFAETQDLNALSLTSRSLRSIAQSMLFENFQIDLKTGLRGLVDNLLANPRICAAIRFLVIHGWHPSCNHEELLSHTQKMLPKMVGLRKVSIEEVDLSKAFLDAVLGIAANKPLKISLEWNEYPYGVIPMPHTPLQISHLDLRVDLPSLEFFRSMLHASATTLTGLRIVVTRGDLERLADVNLPFLHDLSFLFRIGCKDLMTSAAAFITAQKSIKKLELRGSLHPLPPIPLNALPNALPNLRELIASPKLVNQLVPGQPVEAIEVIFSYHEGDQDQDWFGEEVTQSTARVRMLRIPIFKAAALDTRMVKRMVAMVPFLEDLWLPVFDDVSWSFCSITKTWAAHFPLGPQCRRSPHFTQLPQEPRLQAGSS